MKHLELSPFDINKLKCQILEPGFPDKSGRTELNKRADGNRKLELHSENKNKEEALVIGVLDYIDEFKSQDISLLINYIRQSKFSEIFIFENLFKLLTHKLNKISVFQKVEILRYLLEIRPNDIPIELINKGFSELKSTYPWIYAELLSLKSNEKALDYIIYLIQSNNYISTSFINILISWINSQDHNFIKNIYKKLHLIIQDNDALQIMEYKLQEIERVIKPEISNVFFLTQSPSFDLFMSELKKNYIHNNNNNRIYA